MRKDLHDPDVCRIAVAAAVGAPFPGCARAPAAVLALAAEAVGRQTERWLNIPQNAASTVELHPLLAHLAARTAEAIGAGRKLLVLGGDHAIAAGTWRGVGRGLGQAPGLIWIDAHLDAHTPASSVTGNRHGMPLAALLGEGEPAMVEMDGPVLDPRRTVVIGARHWEAEEQARLQKHGVRIHPMSEIAEAGLAAIFEAAVGQVSVGGPWGISLDLDALDPQDAPGVSVPVPDGIRAADLLPLLRGILRCPGCIGLEIVEYNPDFDVAGQTGRLVARLLADAAPAPG